jgi:hypothetical protein
MSNPKFYFQRGESIIDIESTFKIRITQVRGLNKSQPKDLHMRDWASENGVDVYIPSERKIKAGEVVITAFAEKTDFTQPLQKYDQVCDYLLLGEVIYWDEVTQRKVTLIYTEHKSAWYSFIQGNEKLMFEITLLNPSGEVEDIYDPFL